MTFTFFMTLLWWPFGSSKGQFFFISAERKAGESVFSLKSCIKNMNPESCGNAVHSHSTHSTYCPPEGSPNSPTSAEHSLRPTQSPSHCSFNHSTTPISVWSLSSVLSTKTKSFHNQPASQNPEVASLDYCQTNTMHNSSHHLLLQQRKDAQPWSLMANGVCVCEKKSIRVY